MLDLSLVIPTYNESESIRALVISLCELLDAALPGAYEIIVVDDDSPDLTWQVVEKLGESFPQVALLRRRNKRGLASAVVDGWAAAHGNVLGVIDGDCQHPPEIAGRLLEAIDAGADLAVASRYCHGGGVSTWCWTRRLISRGAQGIGLLLLGRVLARVSDPMSGYFLVRRQAACLNELDPIGYKILAEVLARGRISKIVEVPYVFQERRQGGSKLTLGRYIDYLRQLHRLRVSTSAAKASGVRQTAPAIHSHAAR